MLKRSFLYGAMLLLLANSCKKDNTTKMPDPDIVDADKEMLLRDSAYVYSLVLSLWEDKLPQPNGNDLKAFTGRFSTAEQVLDELRKSATQDRFSFVDRAGSVSEEIQEGVYKETGAVPIFLYETSNATKAQMYIRLVQKNSPAAKAGIIRGMKIKSVNGNTNVLLDPNGNNDQPSINLYYKFFSGEALSLVVVHPETGKESTIAVKGDAYQINPIVKDTVINLNGKKVGYFGYTSFVNVGPVTKPNDYYRDMDNVFKKYQAVDELVIDLRYNGGGSTRSAEALANFLVPVAKAKESMYSYKINRHLLAEGYGKPGQAFGPVNFAKPNTLNLKRVYFLVTKSTASASELVINALMPYMDVQIISTSGVGSYGKPVGFFESRVMGGYASFYITSFQMLNSMGYGDYFSGLVGEKKDAFDGFNKQLGDPTESLFSEALYHIANNRYRNSTQSASLRKTNKSGDAILQAAENQPEVPHVSGMYKFADENKSLQIGF